MNENIPGNTEEPAPPETTVDTAQAGKAKPSLPVSIYFLAFWLLVLPMLIPLVAVFADASLWYFCLSKINGVSFLFTYTETLMFVGVFALIYISLIFALGMFQIQLSGKSVKDYNAELKAKQEERKAKMKDKLLKVDWLAVRTYTETFTYYFCVLLFVANIMPGKLYFANTGALLYCLVIEMLCRDIFWRSILAFMQVYTDRLQQRLPNVMANKTAH